MGYKLVVTDMDGTLLNSEGYVSDENREVLKSLIDKGVHVAVATGRIFTSAKVFAKYIGMKTPIIACNGAVVRDLESGETIYSNPIKREDCLKILEVCREHGVYFHFYAEETFYTEKLERRSLKYSEWNKTLKEEERIDIRVIEDSFDVLKNGKEEIYKFVVMDDDLELLGKVRRKLEEVASVECSRSMHNNIEIMNRGVTKGKAVKRLADSLGIAAQDIICFGDNENDISMLEYAGMGIAMGNAENMVKEIAQYVTSTNDEDGVARAIKKFIL